MALVQHSVLTDPELHEPKGVAGANSGEVYVADGAGSGNWSPIDLVTSVGSGAATSGQVATADGAGNITWQDTAAPSEFALTYTFTDISTASNQYLVVPVACTLTRIFAVLNTAITTADTNMVFANSGGTMAGGGMVIAFTASAPGDLYDSTPTTNNTFAAGDFIKVTSDGGSTGTANLGITFLLTPL